MRHTSNPIRAALTLLILGAFVSAKPDEPVPVKLSWAATEVENQQFGRRFTILGSSGEPVASLDNSTRQVLRAVLWGGLVIVLGATGSGNLVTIFGAPKKSECLELLCYDPRLSPNGQFIAFRHFYPPSTADALVQDRIGVLSTAAVRQHRLPCVSKIDFAPPTDLGTDIFPSQSTPGERIFGNLIWRADSKAFFFVDARPPTGYLVGRADHRPERWSIRTSLIHVIPGAVTDTMSIIRFATDGAGRLVVESERATPGAEAKSETTFDPETLQPTPSQSISPAADVTPFDVPWNVVVHTLISPREVQPVKVAMARYRGEIALAHIAIRPDGLVSSVKVDSDSAEVKKAVTSELLTWKFPPTELNGRFTAVATTVPVPLAPGRSAAYSPVLFSLADLVLRKARRMLLLGKPGRTLKCVTVHTTVPGERTLEWTRFYSRCGSATPTRISRSWKSPAASA